MKRLLILLFSVTAFIISSCVKDRLQPASGPVVTTGDSLMYYWDFNAADSSKHAPTYTRASLGPATFRYYCSYIDYTGGTIINAQRGSDSGQCLRVRNPSDSIIFIMPTTGYKNVALSFAEEKSSSGPSIDAIYYTVDGTNYITTALSNNTFNIDVLFALYSFDFTADPATNNNPKFAVKIVFTNNNTGASGNDRIDNVSLFGVKQ